jgi:hypothetical protein
MKSETSYEASVLNQRLAPLPLGKHPGLDEFFARPVYCSTLTVPNFAFTTELHPLSQYLANAQVAEKMKYFRVLNCVVHVRVEMSLTPHYYGWAHLSLASGTRWYPATFSYSNALQIPGATLDFSVSNPVELSMRVSTPNMGIDLFADPGAFNGSDDACSLLFSTVAGLARDDGGSVGTQLFKVYTWLTEVELTSPSIYSVASGGSNDEISTAMAAVAVSERTSPNRERTDESSTINLANGDVKSTALQLSTTSTRATPSDDPTNVEDTLSMPFWSKLWGFVGNFSWANTDAPGAQIAIIPITPVLCQQFGFGPSTSTSFAPVGFLALPYSKWTGSMKIRLRCSATAFHRGRIMIAYTPNPVSTVIPSYSQVTATGECEILDVAAGFDKVFEVHWSQPANSLYVIPAGLQFFDAAGINGSLRVIVVDPLHATTDAASLTISVWAGAGSDLRFLTPSRNASTYTVISSSSSTPMAFDQVIPEPSVRHMGSMKVVTPIVDRAAGPPDQIRELLARPTLDFVLHPCGTEIPTDTGSSVSTRWPTFPWIASENNVHPNVVGVGAAESLLTPLTLLASCFVGFRGGVRHIVTSYGDWSSGYQTVTSVVVTDPAVTRVPTFTPPTYYSHDTSQSNVDASLYLYQYSSAGSQVFRSLTNPSLVADVEVAPRLGYRYTYFQRNDNAAVQEIGFTLLTNVGHNNGTPSVDFSHFAAACKDFQLVGFLGTPTLRNTTLVPIAGVPFPEPP